MRQQKRNNGFRAISLILSGIIFLTTASGLACFSVSADIAEDGKTYEEKEAAYREQLKSKDITSNDLLIGSWVSFYSFKTDSYEYQLDQASDSGLNFLLFPYDFGSPVQHEDGFWDNIEEQFAKRNMLYHINATMDKNYAETAAAFADGKEHCIGYHLIDEPGGSRLQEVADVTKVYRDADPTRYPFTNLLPSYAGEAWLGGTYRQYVERYVELTGAENIDYLSTDYYPFRGEYTIDTGIFADMEVIRSVAYENGKLKTHAFPQSTAWNGTRMPDIDEMRWNVYGYLAYGFKALSWFNLVCPGSSDSEGEGFRDCLIYRDGTIRDPELFEAWSELNWEVRGLSDALMNLDTVHAYHTKENVTGVEYLPGNFFIVPTQNADLIISYMEAKDGTEPYIMIFNKSLRRDVDVEFQIDLSSGIEAIEYLDPLTGEYTAMDLSGGIMKDSYIKGEGKLYRLKGNISLSQNPQEPEVDLASGVYQGTQTVQITPSTSGAAVYYTLDGSYPTTSSFKYEGPISLGKVGETCAYTLRAAAISGNSTSEVVTRQYVIHYLSSDGSNGHVLAAADREKILCVGDWKQSDGSIALSKKASAAVLNYYIDTSRLYDDFYAEATLRFGSESGQSASAGIILKEAEGEGYLYVGIKPSGEIFIYQNGKRIKITDTQNSSIKVSDGFNLRIAVSGETLFLDADGQACLSMTLPAAVSQGYLGINTTKGGAVVSEFAVFSALNEPFSKLQLAVTGVTGTYASVTVGRNTAADELIKKLPQTATVKDESGNEYECSLQWTAGELDTTAGGTFTVHGYPILPEESQLANPHKLSLRATVTVTYDPDRTELDSAIKLMESLVESNYTPETWEAAKQAYETAVGMKNDDVPQTTVNVAAVFLMDKINVLEPVGIDFTELDAAIASLKSLDTESASDEAKELITQALTEAENFTRKGAITQKTVDSLVSRLSEAETAYKNAVESADTAAGTDTDKSANTGCNSAFGSIGGCLIAAGVASMLPHRKKER